MKWGCDTSCGEDGILESHWEKSSPVSGWESQLLYALDNVRRKCDHMLLNELSTSRVVLICPPSCNNWSQASVSLLPEKKRLHPTTTVIEFKPLHRGSKRLPNLKQKNASYVLPQGSGPRRRRALGPSQYPPSCSTVPFSFVQKLQTRSNGSDPSFNPEQSTLFLPQKHCLTSQADSETWTHWHLRPRDSPCSSSSV